MLILYITDTHIYGKNPIGRTDDLTIVQFKKIEEIVEIANEYDCPVIHGGDVFNSPNVGYSIYITLLSILSDLPKGLFLLLGQHDLWWHDINTVNHTASGALINSGYNIHLIGKFNLQYPEFAFDYCHWNDNPTQTSAKFFISHKPIVPKKWVENFHFLKHNINNDKYFLMEDFKQYKLLLCGDWHNQYIYENKNSLLINPGALIRREITNETKDYHPSSVLIDLETLEYELIPLKSAKQKEDVFSEKHLQLVKEYKNIELDVSNFLNTLQITSTQHSHFLNKLIQIINSDKTGKFDNIYNKMKTILHKLYGTELNYDARMFMRKKLKRK